MSKHQRIWLISQNQIREGDIDGAIIAVDPEQLSKVQIRAMRGRVRVRIENATGPASLFGDPAARKYFRSLHHRWPWQAYFLRLAPIDENSPQTQIVDLSLFMALALCHCDDLVYCETDNGVGLRYNPGQLGKHLAELLGRAAELAHEVGISSKAIQQRDKLVAEAVVSFFDAGKNLTQQINQNQNRKRK